MYESIEIATLFAIGIPAIILIPEYLRSIGPVQEARAMLRNRKSRGEVRKYLESRLTQKLTYIKYFDRSGKNAIRKEIAYLEE